MNPYLLAQFSPQALCREKSANIITNPVPTISPQDVFFPPPLATILLPLATLGGVLALIWYLGGGKFGRGQTQRWIDHTRRWPAVNRLLERLHGNARAAAHYVEFGALFLALYWVQDTFLGSGHLLFEWIPSVVVAMLCAAAAWLDELHQLRSGGRQFRRVDFLHSCCGITIAMAIIFYRDLLLYSFR